MATLSSTALTLADWGKRIDPNGKVDTVINLLSQSNEILQDMLWIEGNLPTGHKTTVQTGLPTNTWRLLNYGVQPSKSTTSQVVDACGMLEAYSKVDKALADLNGDVSAFRLSEDRPFLESMNQTMASTLFYGNTQINPERFMGLTPRYNSLSASVGTSANIIDAGGTGSTNASIWFVCWDPNYITGIFPKGGKAGLSHEDVTTPAPVQDAVGGNYQAYQTHYKWDCGLSVRDWRYAVRIANIDVSLLGGGSAANLINAMVRAVNRLPTAPVSAGPVQMIGQGGQPSGVMGRTAIYCNRTVRTYLDIQALNKTNVLLQQEQWDGKPVLTFRGIPVRNVDGLLSTEARVV